MKITGTRSYIKGKQGDGSAALFQQPRKYKRYLRGCFYVYE